MLTSKKDDAWIALMILVGVVVATWSGVLIGYAFADGLHIRAAKSAGCGAYIADERGGVRFYYFKVD